MTAYRTVADEIADSCTASQTNADERLKEKKNIRRRVYDALNVLLSVGVIHKVLGNKIAWCGIPRTLSEAISAQNEGQRLVENRRKIIARLRRRLFNSSLQYLALKEIADDNRKRDGERQIEKPSHESLKVPHE